MTTTAIRKKLHDYIADATDNKVKGMYLLLEDEISKIPDFNLTPEQLIFLETEKEKHIIGQSKSYNWEEAKEIIVGNKKL